MASGTRYTHEMSVGAEKTRLERRPDATSFQVDDLLERVRAGQLRLPHFQRPQKWLPRDRLDLFDSLYRGFPIGTLLLWKAHANAEPVKFGEFSTEGKKVPDALWVVDGQQRVTTLASSLLVPHRPGERALLFDLVEQRFFYGRVPTDEPTLPGVNETRVALVEDLFDSTRAISWMAARMKSLRPELVQRALDCGKRLREYLVPVYIVETDDEDVLRDIFDRINRTGRRLDDTDVFTALFATRTEAGERIDLGHVSRRVARIGFGKFEEKTVLSALRAIEGIPLEKDFTGGIDREGSAAVLARTEAALQRVAKFLIEAGIPHVALMPYALIAIVLARFFDRHAEPRRRNLLLLRRWLWRGSLGGKLTGASVSLRQHVDAVDGDEDQSVQRLLQLDPAPRLDVDIELGAFRLDTAKSKLAACALASLFPRDLRTGEHVDVAAMFDAEPKRPLPEIVSNGGELGRGVANRLLHTPMRSREIVDAIVAAEPTALESHAIPPAARDALAADDPARFLVERAAALRSALTTFFERQAEYGADDSPAIASILADEEQ